MDGEQGALTFFIFCLWALLIYQLQKNLLYTHQTLTTIMASTYYDTLLNQEANVGLRYQAVFQLKNIASEQAIQMLMKAYPHCGSSILLKHELLYALGQLPDEFYPQVHEFLLEKVQDEDENNLSRHEAAEALANYFREQMIPIYQKYSESTCNELRWTCQIAYEKVKQKKLRQMYGTKYHKTMEPSPPFTPQQFKQFLQQEQFEELFKQKGYLGLLCDPKLSLFKKYRTMYYMRDIGTQQCIETLSLLLSKEYFKTQTSLLKHEICFILGQIGCDGYEHLIRECIQNEQEEDIVRHQALAAVASQSKDIAYLEKFVNHPSQLIRESAVVAQFTIKYWNE